MESHDCSDMGAHIDGFIAVVAHTVIVGSSAEKKVTGRKADVVLAAHFASQAALRLLKPGTEVGLRRFSIFISRVCYRVLHMYHGLSRRAHACVK